MPYSRPALLLSFAEFLLVSLFSLMHTETKPTGLLLIRNMQIHLLISYIESLRLSLNTWLALILAWYSSRTPWVTEVNCSPRADSQLSCSDSFFSGVYTWLPAEVPSPMQDSNSWATFKVFIENYRLIRPVRKWKHPDRPWIHNLGLLVLLRGYWVLKVISADIRLVVNYFCSK